MIISGLDMDFGLNVGGRNCDRAVEWSPALEARNEIGALLGCHAAELQLNAHGVEEIDVLADGGAGILGGLDGRVDGPQRHVLLLCQDLDQLDAARREVSEATAALEQEREERSAKALQLARRNKWRSPINTSANPQSPSQNLP